MGNYINENIEEGFKEVYSILKKYDKITIYCHVSPDYDCLGSAVGFKEMIETTWPHKKVLILAQENDLEILPYSQSTPDLEHLKGGLAFSVDCANLERVYQWEETAHLADYRMKFDHHVHEDKNNFGDTQLVSIKHPATCMIATDFWQSIGTDKLIMTKTGAKALYLGTLTDTGRFMYRGSGPSTLRLAADLLDTGFDKEELQNQLYSDSLEMVKMKSWMTSNMVTTDDGFIYLTVSKKQIDKLNTSESMVSRFVNVMGGIKGFPFWALFVEDVDDDNIRCNFRSRGIECRQIAVKYGGGGHANAAGARVKNFTEVESVIADCRKLAREYSQSKN